MKIWDSVYICLSLHTFSLTGMETSKKTWSNKVKQDTFKMGKMKGESKKQLMKKSPFCNSILTLVKVGGKVINTNCSIFLMIP